MKSLPRIILPVVAVAAALPAAAQAQTAPLTADFAIDPAAPEAGQTVAFTSTSSGGGSGTLTLAWDLDDDGAFDDGTERRVTRAFTAGAHTVRLRATRSGPVVQTDVATKTVTVTAPEPTPTPTPAPPAGSANQAPEASIELACGALGRGRQVCLTPYTKVHVPKTFDASPSRDADGNIVRYEWDLDGDGRFETNTGGQPKATTTYGDMNPVTIGLRVTDDRGATGQTSLQLKKVEPECETRVTYRLLGAVSPCLRRYHYDGGDGSKIMMPNGRLRSGAGYTGDQYRSEHPVIVNGIAIAPAAGKSVIVNVIDWNDGKGTRVTIRSASAVATITKGEDTVTVDDGRIDWTLDGDRLRGVEKPAGGTLGRLPIAAMSADPKLGLGAGSTFAFMLRMPQQFGAPTSDTPVKVVVGGARALGASRGATARAAAADAPLHFEVRHAVLGPMEFNRLELDYDGNGFWEIAADVTLPPPADARVKAGAGILDGAFNYAGADVTFQDQGMNIIGPVFLKRIKFRVEVKPKRSECVPHIGVEPRPAAGPIPIATAPGMPEQPQEIDYGVPTFALCGEVGMVVGPTIAGVSAIALDAGLGFAMYDDRPAVLRAFGEAKLVGIPLADAKLELHTDGYIEADAHAKWIWPGVAEMHGALGIEMLGSQFNAHGRVDACLPFVDWCAAGARAVLSNKGAAVCLKIDYELETWEPGIGYRWGESPTLYFAGCELGPYKNQVTHARAAAAEGEQSVAIDAGLPGAAIALEGLDAPPNVTLIGPNGERVTTPAGLEPLKQGRFFVLKDPNANLTQIAIVAPSGGRWRIVTEPGSSPIAGVKTADGVDAPKVKAKVVKRGQRRYIDYTVKAQPGQTVRFAERGDSAGQILGRATGRRGRIRFTPADGTAERRQIVAIVDQNGLPSAQVAVASYRAPAARRPTRPRGVRMTRRGRSVRVSWVKDGAPSHVVVVATSDGRRRVARVERRRHLVLRGIGRRLRVRASVKAVGRNGMLGPAARARLGRLRRSTGA